MQAQREVARLLEDDNVTYTPSPASAISIADEPNGMARLWRRRPASSSHSRGGSTRCR